MTRRAKKATRKESTVKRVSTKLSKPQWKLPAGSWRAGNLSVAEFKRVAR